MHVTKGDTSPAAIKIRLEDAAQALGITMAELASQAELGRSTLSNINTPTQHGGVRSLSVESAIKLAIRHNLTLDYIFLGDSGSLRDHVREKLAAPRKQKK